MIRLTCYEPPGLVLELGPEDLTRHLLALGSTGSGKTTGLMNPVLRQLIQWRAGKPTERIGLLVLDPKEDETDQKIAAYAADAGRAGDVTVLSAQGNSFYDLFGGFRRLEQVDEFTRRLLSGSRDMGDQNAYWTESRHGIINSCLTVLLASSKPITFDSVTEFVRAWVYDHDSAAVRYGLSFVERLLGCANLKPTTRRRLQLALAEASNWKALDGRTRELHKSALNNALRPLLSPAARDLFDPSRGSRFNPADVLHGRILVASINAVCHPQLAAVLFKALKREFFEAVLSRVAVRPESERLCGLILDELPLSAMPGDVDSLALIRSKGGFVVACSQGINALDEGLGWRRRKALLTNFNSVFFFGSREDETDELAMLTLGTHEQKKEADTSEGTSPIQAMELPRSWRMVPVCPAGSLSKLGQHQAYVKLANGAAPNGPVWIAPLFFDYIAPKIRAQPDDLTEAAAALLREEEAQAPPSVSSGSGVSFFLLRMHREGNPLILTPSIVASAGLLCAPKVSRNEVLRLIPTKIVGLELLPTCWLMGLHRWLLKYPALVTIIEGVSISSGVLWPRLHPATLIWGDGAFSIPQSLNLFIYPSLWRPLRRRHWAHLRSERPDLRQELESQPQMSADDANG
jgi:hypothetical protein